MPAHVGIDPQSSLTAPTHTVQPDRTPIVQPDCHPHSPARPAPSTVCGLGEYGGGEVRGGRQTCFCMLIQPPTSSVTLGPFTSPETHKGLKYHTL